MSATPLNLVCTVTSEQTQEVVLCASCTEALFLAWPVDDSTYVLAADPDLRCESCAAHYGRILLAENGQANGAVSP